jgi:uncharacterized membrane protein (DUF485 family)
MLQTELVWWLFSLASLLRWRDVQASTVLDIELVKRVDAPLFDQGTFLLVQNYTLMDEQPVCISTRGNMRAFDGNIAIQIEPVGPQSLSDAGEVAWCASMREIAQTPWVIYSEKMWYPGLPEFVPRLQFNFTRANDEYALTREVVIRSADTWGRMVAYAEDRALTNAQQTIGQPCWIRFSDQTAQNYSLNLCSLGDDKEGYPACSYANTPVRHQQVRFSVQGHVEALPQALAVYRKVLNELFFAERLSVTYPPLNARVRGGDDVIITTMSTLDKHNRAVLNAPVLSSLTMVNVEFAPVIEIRTDLAMNSVHTYTLPKDFLPLLNDHRWTDNPFDCSYQAMLREYANNHLQNQWNLCGLDKLAEMLSRLSYLAQCGLDTEWSRRLSIELYIDRQGVWLGDTFLNRLPAREYTFYQLRYRVQSVPSLVRVTPLRIYSPVIISRGRFLLDLFVPQYEFYFAYNGTLSGLIFTGLNENLVTVSSFPRGNNAEQKHHKVHIRGVFFSLGGDVRVNYELCGLKKSFVIQLPHTMIYSTILVLPLICKVLWCLLHSGQIARGYRKNFNSFTLSVLLHGLTHFARKAPTATPALCIGTRLHRLVQYEVGLLSQILPYLSLRESFQLLESLQGLNQKIHKQFYGRILTLYYQSLFFDFDRARAISVLDVANILRDATGLHHKFLLNVITSENASFVYTLPRQKSFVEVHFKQLLRRTENYITPVAVLVFSLYVSYPFFYPFQSQLAGGGCAQKKLSDCTFGYMNQPGWVVLNVILLQCLAGGCYLRSYLVSILHWEHDQLSELPDPVYAPRPLTQAQSRCRSRFFNQPELERIKLHMRSCFSTTNKDVFDQIRSVDSSQLLRRVEPEQVDASEPIVQRSSDLQSLWLSGESSLGLDDMEQGLSTPLLSRSVSLL